MLFVLRIKVLIFSLKKNTISQSSDTQMFIFSFAYNGKENSPTGKNHEQDLASPQVMGASQPAISLPLLMAGWERRLRQGKFQYITHPLPQKGGRNENWLLSGLLVAFHPPNCFKPESHISSATCETFPFSPV